MMTAWKVDKVVGNVKKDTPDLIEHTQLTEPAAQTLFG
jgi:hypothetical protein